MKTKQTPHYIIPNWTHHLRVVASGIDGRPPGFHPVYTVPDFLAKQQHILSAPGHGEWSATLYAVGADTQFTESHRPHCPTWRCLRKKPGTPGELRELYTWGYMEGGMIHATFSAEPPAPKCTIVSQLAGCEWQGQGPTLKRLIFEARTVSGWKKSDLYK